MRVPIVNSASCTLLPCVCKIRSAYHSLWTGSVWRAWLGQKIFAKVVEGKPPRPRAFVSLHSSDLLRASCARVATPIAQRATGCFHQARCRIISCLPLGESYQRHSGCSVAGSIPTTYCQTVDIQIATLCCRDAFLRHTCHDGSQDR
jgi:hypothetical protein